MPLIGWGLAWLILFDKLIKDEPPRVRCMKNELSGALITRRGGSLMIQLDGDLARDRSSERGELLFMILGVIGNPGGEGGVLGGTVTVFSPGFAFSQR